MDSTMHTSRRAWVAVGAVLLLATAVTHVIPVGEVFEEAPYLGVLFLVNAAVALLLLGALLTGRSWAWPAAAVFAGATVLGFVAARTVGLPQYAESNWLEVYAGIPIGLISVLAELGILVAFLATRRLGGAQPIPS